jgi:hypothetical protein
MKDGIREIDIEKDQDGNYKNVRIVFGPHYFVELFEQGGKMQFVLGATHHGFMADASKVDGVLEKIIEHIREQYPKYSVD